MNPGELINEMNKVKCPDYLYREIVDPQQKKQKFRYIFQHNRKVAIYLQTIYDPRNSLEGRDYIQVKVQYRVPEYANKPLFIKIPLTTPEAAWRKVSIDLSSEIVCSWVNKLENETKTQAFAEKIARDTNERYKAKSCSPIVISMWANPDDPMEPHSVTSVRLSNLTEKEILNFIDVVKCWCDDHHYQEEDDEEGE